jgi:hypothetical protein
MVFMIPTYTVEFMIPAEPGVNLSVPKWVKWAVSEGDIETVAKVLRCNGIKEYSVKEGDPRHARQVAS